MSESRLKVILAAILVFVLLIIAGGGLYWLLWWREPLGVNYYKLEPTGPEQGVDYHPVGRQPTDPVLTDIIPEGSDETLTRVLKGYFQQLDGGAKTIQLKHKFLNSTYLQVVEANYQDLTSFYCWPEEVDGEEGLIPTHTLEFFVNPDGSEIYMPGEKAVRIELLGDFLAVDQFVIVQLWQPFALRGQNPIQKLIILGC